MIPAGTGTAIPVNTTDRLCRSAFAAWRFRILPQTEACPAHPDSRRTAHCNRPAADLPWSTEKRHNPLCCVLNRRNRRNESFYSAFCCQTADRSV